MRAVLAGVVACALLGSCSGAVTDAGRPAVPTTTLETTTAPTAPTPAPTTTTSTPTSTVIGANLLAGALAAAWNLGDLEAYWSFFAADATWNGERRGSADLEVHFEFMGAIGWRVVASDCERRSDAHATCRTVFVDDITEPAGIEALLTEDYWFDDAGFITSYASAGGRLTDRVAFFDAFDLWLGTEHPNLALQWNESESGYPGAAVCASVIAAAAEFLQVHPEQRLGADPVIPAPVLGGSVHGVDVFNADDRQMDLVAWALERFAIAGLAPPPVTAVVFPPTAACHRGASGVTIHSNDGSSINVCVIAQDLQDDDQIPCRARRTILHELGHVWNALVATEATRQEFLDVRGLEEWRADVWQDSGSEQAAEIIMWGLLDQNVKPRIPDAECPALHTAFEMLTGTRSAERLADCDANP